MNSAPDQPQIGAMTQDEQQPPGMVDSRIAVDGNMIEFAKADAPFLQAILDRMCRQTSPMFDPAKAFFLSRGDDLSIAKQTRRRVPVVSVDA